MRSTDSLSKIRQTLHQHPETAGNEHTTAATIYKHLQPLKPTKIVTNIAGHGLAALYTGHQPGPTIVIRAELDAVPIPEKTTIAYQSQKPGISHACGHDGHMTILLGIATYLHQHHEEIKGTIVLLFQPAEETAAGAQQICSHPFYQQLKPDYIFALHNLPGYEAGTIIIKKGVFAIASQGCIIHLTGATAHAGHPEQGNNPVFCIAEIIKKIAALSKEYQKQHKQAMITIIHLKLGNIAFGTTPGTGILMATLRAPTNTMLTNMSQHLIKAVSTTAEQYALQHTIQWVEQFPATNNNPRAVTLIERAAKQQHMKLQKTHTPFSWTEDFSYYLMKTPGALFGLGSGKNHPVLHSNTYDFPDKLLILGVQIFLQLIKEINTTYSQETV